MDTVSEMPNDLCEYIGMLMQSFNVASPEQILQSVQQQTVCTQTQCFEENDLITIQTPNAGGATLFPVVLAFALFMLALLHFQPPTNTKAIGSARHDGARSSD